MESALVRKGFGPKYGAIVFNFRLLKLFANACGRIDPTEQGSRGLGLQGNRRCRLTQGSLQGVVRLGILWVRAG
jgi:hypothetical protein